MFSHLASVLIPSLYQNQADSMLKLFGRMFQLVLSVSHVDRKPSNATVEKDLGSCAAAGLAFRPQ